MPRRRKRRGDGPDVIPTDFLTDVLKTAFGVILGTVVSMVATGFMFKYFVLDKAMENKKVKKIQNNLDRLIDDLDRVMDKLEELLQVKNGNAKTLPEAADYEAKTG
jgi:hypothetical protein